MGSANNRRTDDVEYSTTYCTNCGNEVAPTDNHCSKCGAPISNIDTGDPPTTWEESPELQSAVTRVSGEEAVESTPNDHRGESTSIELTNQTAAIGGMAIIFIGTFLPWVTISALGTRASALGIETIALIVTLASGLLVYALWDGEWDSNKREGAVIVSACALLFALTGLFSPMTLLLAEADSDLQRAITSPGVGVYITGIGSILSLIGGRQVLDE